MGAIGLLNIVASAVWYSVLGWHVSLLATSLENLTVRKRATRLTWLGPVMSTVGIVLCGLGPLITIILAYNLLTTLRKDFVLQVKAMDEELQSGRALGAPQG